MQTVDEALDIKVRAIGLISKTERQKAVQIAQNVAYIELAAVPNFNRKFAAATIL